jgi:putative hydrolase of the HAD superfamily
VSAEVASLEKKFWKEVVRLVFAEAGGLGQFRDGQFDRYFDRLFDYFATSAGWTIYPDVVPLLGDLKRRGFILGLITNFDHRVFRLIDALDLARFIDSITIPALAGAAKPEAAIFGYALARHGLQASEAVQVGDSIRDDVEGACAAGLRGVLLDREDRAGADDVERIRSLAELPPLIGLR